MFILGLTGSVGMGKSATAKMFADEGVPVHDADAAVHALYEGEAVAAIEAAFPGTTANGRVDRGKLGERVIGHPDEIKRLERIVHPLVARVCDAFLAKAKAIRQGDPRDEATDIGPQISRPHFQRIDGFVRRAKDSGLQPVLGGAPNPELGGLYYRPTLFVDAPARSEI